MSYPNFHLNRYYGPFFLKCVNGIQGTKPARRQWNRILDAMVTILKYKKITIGHAIYTKIFYDGTVSYITVYTYDILNTTNNETSFTQLRIFFEEAFDIKVQE